MAQKSGMPNSASTSLSIGRVSARPTAINSSVAVVDPQVVCVSTGIRSPSARGDIVVISGGIPSLTDSRPSSRSRIRPHKQQSTYHIRRSCSFSR